MSKLVVSNSGLPSSTRENPPVPFTPKVRKLDSSCVENKKLELTKFDFFIDTENTESRYSKDFVIFKGGKPEDWIKLFDGIQGY
jgi:hypothetical protein